MYDENILSKSSVIGIQKKNSLQSMGTKGFSVKNKEKAKKLGIKT